MRPYQETELKLRLTDPAMYDQLISDPHLTGMCAPGSLKTADYDSTYYDTDDRRLLASGLVLRLRNTGAGYVATVKDSGAVAGGLHIRGEWNKSLENGEFSIGAFSDLPVGEKLADIVGEKALHPLMQTVFKRVSLDLQADKGCIEFAADKGEIIADGKRLPFCEVELELKSGCDSGLLMLGALLAERYPLAVEEKSKFERGLILFGFNQARSVTETPLFIPGQTIRDVMADSITGALHAVLRAQEQLAQNSGDSETIHQFRVSVRRLRALLSFGKPAMEGVLYKVVTKKLRALASSFSYVRELDVLMDKYRSVHREQAVSGKNEPGLSALLGAERQREQDELASTLSTYPVTAVLLRLWGLVLGEIWTKKADMPFEDFGEKRLNKWTSALRQGLKKEIFKDLRQAHRLRILGKKVRYVQNALFTGKEDDVSIKMRNLKQLQTLLGQLHDSDRNIQILQALTKSHPDPAIRQEGNLFIGAQRHDLKTLTAALRKTV